MLSRIHRPIRVAALAAIALSLLTACSTGPGAAAATVGGQDGSGQILIGADGSVESRVVAALYAQALTSAGKKVSTRPGLYASSAEAAKAVLSGEITLAPAYETLLLHALPPGTTMPGNLAATLSMALPLA